MVPKQWMMALGTNAMRRLTGSDEVLVKAWWQQPTSERWCLMHQAASLQELLAHKWC